MYHCLFTSCTKCVVAGSLSLCSDSIDKGKPIRVIPKTGCLANTLIYTLGNESIFFFFDNSEWL